MNGNRKRDKGFNSGALTSHSLGYHDSLAREESNPGNYGKDAVSDVVDQAMRKRCYQGW